MKTTSVQNRKPFPALALCACVVLLLAACGQTGPLFLPDESSQEAVADDTTVPEEAVEETIEEDDQTP